MEWMHTLFERDKTRLKETERKKNKITKYIRRQLVREFEKKIKVIQICFYIDVDISSQQ